MDDPNFLGNLNESLTTKSVDEIKYEHIVSELSCGKIKFLTVVESLQEVLTHETVNIRERGVDFLARIMTQISQDLLNCSEITAIVNFYCDCLKGHHNFIPATIKGLLAIVKMKNTTKADILKILVHLFQHVNCGTQLQIDRFNLHNLLESVVVNHLQDIKQMGPDFVFGLISFIEGETDPKCLHHIFKFLPAFIAEFDLGHLSEELFEVLSCYFPVDFNAAAKDDTKISRDDLAEGLQQCLTANESFSVQCLPIIFEKLDSNFRVAKLDSYKLLQKCSKMIGVENIESHLTEFWKLVQKDVLPGQDKEVCEAGLSALTHVVSLLSKHESSKDILVKFLGDIIGAIKSLASKVDENMFQPAISVLVATSVQSKIAANNVLLFIKPFYQIGDTKASLELKIILTSFLPFLKLCSTHKLYQSDDTEVLSSYKALVNLYISSAMYDDYDIRKIAYSGVSIMIPDYSQEAREKLYEVVVHNIKTNEDIKKSKEFLNVIRVLAQYHPEELHMLLFDHMKISPHQLEPYTAGYLWAVSLLADHPSFTSFTVPVLLEFVVNSQNYELGLESLLNACEYAKEMNSIHFYKEVHKKHEALKQLISWWQNNCRLDGKTLLDLSKSIALITRYQDSAEQQIIVDNFTQLLTNNLGMGEGDCNSTIGNNLTLKIDQSVVIIEAVLGSVRPEVVIPDISTIRNLLLSTVLSSPNENTRLHSSRLLASIINKSEESVASDILNHTFETIYSELDKPTELSLKSSCAFLFTWMIKGVMLRGKPSFEECLFKWFDMLGREDVGEHIAEGFQVVLQDEEMYLNFESHCNVRVLYRQRIFGYFSKLLKMYENCKEAAKENYLLALARLLQGTPKHLIQAEISSVTLLLLKCLSSDKSDIILTALGITKDLLEVKETILGDRIVSFVPNLLRLSTFETNMKIRMEALRCLFFYASYATFILLPFKTKVVHDLEICLDDKKRLVRREAVKSRCRWFLVGAPGEDIVQSL